MSDIFILSCSPGRLHFGASSYSTYSEDGPAWLLLYICARPLLSTAHAQSIIYKCLKCKENCVPPKEKKHLKLERSKWNKGGP